MKRAPLAVVLVGAFTAPARAEVGISNYLVGPLFGIRLTGPSDGHHAIIGIEGGIGWGPDHSSALATRFNLGFEHRSDRNLAYLEFDPWLLIGGSFGFGIDSAGEGHGIIGAWEGFRSTSGRGVLPDSRASSRLPAVSATPVCSSST